MEVSTERERLLSILPQGWKFERDVLLVVGSGASAAVDSYRCVGQARIVVVLPSCSAAPEDLPADVLVTDIERVAAAVQNLGTGIVQHAWMVRTDDGDVTPDFVARLRKEVAIGLRTRAMNHGTMRKFGSDWLLKSIGNLPAVASNPSIAALADAFRGRPAVVVSPGPSLSKQLEHLAALDGRAVVIAGSHALHALESAGVAADVAMVIDAGEELLRHFEGLDTGALGALVASVNVHRDVLRLPIAAKFLVSINGALDGWAFSGLGEHASIASGGSVSCAAFTLALHMGCDPVVLVGQDLAFSGGRFYAEETLDGNAGVVERDGRFFLRKPEGASGPGPKLPDGGLQFSREQGSVRLPGYYGGEVASSEYLREFHAWFEAEARRTPRRARLVNATEGGACIAGMEQVPFAEIAATFKTRCDAAAVLRERAAIPVERRRADYRAFVEGLSRALDESSLLASRCRRLAERAALDPRSLDQLARHEADLRRVLAPVRFLTLLAQEELDEAQERARTAANIEENLAAVDGLMQVVLATSDLLRGPLRAAQEAI